MTCKIFYSAASNHCVTKLCKQHVLFCKIVQPTSDALHSFKTTTVLVAKLWSR